MKKNILIALLISVACLQFAYTEHIKVNNPSLMHMRRREFIAAGVIQGLLSHHGAAVLSPEVLAKYTLQYTNALMVALDNEDKEND